MDPSSEKLLVSRGKKAALERRQSQPGVTSALGGSGDAAFGSPLPLIGNLVTTRSLRKPSGRWGSGPCSWEPPAGGESVQSLPHGWPLRQPGSHAGPQALLGSNSAGTSTHGQYLLSVGLDLYAEQRDIIRLLRVILR